MYDNIVLKLRDLIQDTLVSASPDIYEFTSSKVFTLSEKSLDSTTIVVYKNGTLVTASNYSYSSATNKLTFIPAYSLTAGDVIEVDYSAYLKYSTTELEAYVRSAIVYISCGQYKTFKDRCGVLYPTPTEAEENLIALVASLIIKRSIQSYKTNEISIVFNEKDTLEEKISKVIYQFNKPNGIFDFHDLDNWTYLEELE